jgi:hypothetical protein
MAPIDDAIAAFKLQDPDAQLSLQAISDQYGVERSTLGRRVRGVTRPKQVQAAAQQHLNPQQELELCAYIEDLTKQGLPPTRAMIQNFASKVAKTRVSNETATISSPNGPPVWTLYVTTLIQGSNITYISTSCIVR